MGGGRGFFNERPGLRLFAFPRSSGADALRSSAALEFCGNSVAGFSHKLSVTYALQTVP